MDRGRVRSRSLIWYVIGGASVVASVLFVLANRRAGLGYFDGSEYALHIEGGGIAHAPGYPLYTLLGRAIHLLGADGFLAQHLISAASLVVSALALYATWRLEVGRKQAGFAPALAVALVSLASSYYLRLFAILPEVFDLNVALMALCIWAVTGFHYSQKPLWLGFLFLIFGFGLCHHHTLALLVPGCLTLVVRRWRSIRVRAALHAFAGLCVGCLPLVYLFATRNQVGVTYLNVRDLRSLLFVLLRKGYGTFHLSPLQEPVDVAGLLTLALQGLAQNYHYFGLLLFAPLFAASAAKKPPAQRTAFSIPDSAKANAGYRWSSPSLLVAVSGLLMFFVVFVPNCNLQLGVRSYQTIFLRFLTIPCFLLTYLVFKAALQAWHMAATFGRTGQQSVAGGLMATVFVPALVTNGGLHYRDCDILDEHIRLGFQAIENYTKPAPSPLDPSIRKCAIFAQGDTLLMGIKYFNHRVTAKDPRIDTEAQTTPPHVRCFVYSQTSLSGQFLDRREIRLASSLLGVDAGKIEAGELATHPEALLNLFLQLDRQGYGLFVFSVTDFTEYFGKLFAQSPFAYRPVGNILQVITQSSKPWGMDQMYGSYEAYVRDLEAYLGKLQGRRLPTIVVDSQANQALILNLGDYTKFARFYPQPPEVVATLLQRAESVQTQWLKHFPRE
jgi:hypothetical protein